MKLIFSYIKGWLKTPNVYTDLKQDGKLYVSILIAARNEEKNIVKCLNSLIKQNYNLDLVELLLLDDFSEDKTVLFANKFNKVKVIKLSDFLDFSFKEKANKKRAISIGVSQTKHENIITIDADCLYGKNWLKAMCQAFEKKQAKLLTAPVLFNKETSLFSKFLELDIISLMGITAAGIKNKEPSMVNGANLMFKKKDFLDLNAFKGNEDVASGDDVFLMQKINQTFPNDIHFLKNTDAIAYTDSPSSFREFVNQRIRWTSKSSKYADRNVILTLTLNYLFYFFLLLNFILGIFHINYFFLSLAMFLFKIIVDAIFFKNVLSFFNRKDLMKSILIIEVLHLVYINILGILSLIGRYSWKGRNI